MPGKRAGMLRERFANISTPLRPILTFLNGDNSWLLSFPRPVAERASTAKVFFHIVYDPWLIGPAVTFAPWLANIELAAPPFATDGKDVEAIACEIEDAAVSAGNIAASSATKRSSPVVDVILVHHNLSDHNHEQTLRTFDQTIPVFASKDSFAAVTSYNHFSDVKVIPELVPGDGNWRGLHPGSPLPGWLSPFRLVGNGNGELNFATALIWSTEAEEHEMVLYSPHGIPVDHPSFQTLAHSLTPSVSTLAMMFSLKDNFAWGFRQTLGVDVALPVARQLKPKHWIVTADSPLQYSGIALLGVKDTPRTLASALENEKNAQCTELDTSFVVPNPLKIDHNACFFLD